MTTAWTDDLVYMIDFCFETSTLSELKQRNLDILYINITV